MIISLSGRKSSGKTTLANECVKRNYILINFGDQLKYLVCKMLNISYEFLDNNKEKSIKEPLNLKNYKEFLEFELGFKTELYLLDKNIKTYRELLQYLGTEIIRSNKPNWHIERVDEYLKNNDLLNKNIVFADTRFINELNYIKSLNNNTCWYILSPCNFKNISNHVSETELNWRNFTNVLVNTNDKTTIDNWNKYLDTFDREYLKINYNIPEIYFDNKVSENISSKFLVYNGNFYIEKTSNTSLFLQNIKDKKEYNNHYIIDNPYIIESLKVYFQV